MLELFMGFPDGSAGKEFACSAGDLGSIPGWEDPLEKEKATHSSILPWRILIVIKTQDSRIKCFEDGELYKGFCQGNYFLMTLLW